MNVEAVIGLITAVLGLGVLGFEFWRRRDQADARNRDARVLAVELLPIVKAIHEDLSRALKRGWDTDHWNIHAWQEPRISGADALERFLPRLPVLDDNTSRPILGVWSAMRDYHRLQSADMRELTQAAVMGELLQRRSWLETACQNAAEAIKRLQGTASHP